MPLGAAVLHGAVPLIACELTLGSSVTRGRGAALGTPSPVCRITGSLRLEKTSKLMEPKS